MELSTGRLPWSHIPKARKDKVCREKQLARGLQRTLFLGDCPREYHKIMDAIDYWNYFAEPDYLGVSLRDSIKWKFSVLFRSVST